MASKTASAVSEYERKRLETIAKNKALLRDLQIDAAASGLAPVKSRPKPAGSKKASRKSAPARVKEESPGPRRLSARLRGVVADSEVAKRQAEDDLEQRRQEDQAKEKTHCWRLEG